jgi:hypothetical protein
LQRVTSGVGCPRAHIKTVSHHRDSIHWKDGGCSEPEIGWFDTPVIVDNQAGGGITQAA